MLGFLLTHDGEMASVLLALKHGAMCKNGHVLSQNWVSFCEIFDSYRHDFQISIECLPNLLIYMLYIHKHYTLIFICCELVITLLVVT